MFYTSIAERIVVRLSHWFLRLPIIQDIQAIAWREGVDAERYGYADRNPYNERDE